VTPFEAPGEIVRRRASLLVASLAVFGAALGLESLGVPSWATLVEQGLGLALLFAFAVNQWRLRRAGRVRADAGGLWMDGRSVVTRTGIASAYLSSIDRPTVRVVRRRALPLEVHLEDHESARALVDALGFGVGQAIVTFRAFYGGRRRMWALMLGAVIAYGALGSLAGVLVHHTGPVTGFAVMAASLGIAAVVTQLRLTARVDVGSDGVMVRRLAQHRFIPYAALKSATLDAEDIVLEQSDGERLRLATGTSAEQIESRDALVRCIEQARENYANGGAAENTAALLAPGGRGVAHWLREVRSLAKSHDYRQASLATERLWRVVHDPSLPAATRAGAAVALAGTPEGDTGARLRIAAEACADPRLRVALVRVADGVHDGELEDALASLLDEAESPRIEDD
jgi:hypothetical protein